MFVMACVNKWSTEQDKVISKSAAMRGEFKNT